jgi:hypothetical protein
VEAKSNLNSGQVRSPGAVRNKTDAQVAYGVGFGRSIYAWQAQFHRASNDTGLMPNFVLNQRESAKQVDVQNLLGRCANTFWAVGPIGGPCGPRVLFTRVNSTLGYFSVAPRDRRGLCPLFR